MGTIHLLRLEEKIQVVKDIYTKLNEVGLLGQDVKYEAISQLKIILNNYIKENITNGLNITGEIPFPEMQKVIKYRLPRRVDKKAMVVLEHRLPSYFV